MRRNWKTGQSKPSTEQVQVGCGGLQDQQKHPYNSELQEIQPVTYGNRDLYEEIRLIGLVCYVEQSKCELLCRAYKIEEHIVD